MRRGHTFKRCSRCGRRVAERRCQRCGWDAFSWSFVVDIAPPGFPRHQQRRGGFVTRAEAIEGMARLQVEMQEGTYVKPSRLTTGDYLNLWIQRVSREGSIRPTTAKAYEVAVRLHSVPYIGTIPLQQLTRANLRQLYASLRESGLRRGGPGGLSPKGVHNVHLALHRALEDAVDDGLIKVNPATRAHRITPPRREMTSWSAVELHRFLEAVADLPSFPLWRLAASTGMRRGELLGLRWTDIDLERGVLTVQRQLLRNGHAIVIGQPKTNAGRRSIYLDKTTISSLVEHRRRQAELRGLRTAQAQRMIDLVFCRANGQPHDPDVITNQFRRLILSLGMPRIRFHDLRHTHASLALQAEVHPKVVQERLGHASVKLTLDTYAHVLPPMHADAARRFSALVDSPS